MQRKVTTPPATEAITLEQAQFQVKAEPDPDNDQLLDLAIVAARERVEHELGRPLLAQTCEKRFDAFERRMDLWEDVTAVTSVSYVDDTGQPVPLGQMQFYMTGGRTLNIVGDLPQAREVIVEFECGAFDVETVPKSIVEWMLLQIGAMSENRSTVESIQTYELPARWTDGLIDRYRVYSV
ncbi:putative phiE125 gp8 family phage protein [Paraburkholderia sp. JPY465]|uniref:head-tail connector protein n=1 Tax=Paraburkholderia sp. JPY465 TaxID=3042285 RepID=UPI003D2218A5